MNIKYLNKRQLIYYVIYQSCKFIAYIPHKIGNWAVDKLNKSYFKE
jgi:hypothetical protein